MIELVCEECNYKSSEESDFAIGYEDKTLCVDCKKAEINQAFQKAIEELDEIILIEKKELAQSEECLCYMGLNEFDERIENNIKDIIKFYIEDLKNQISQHESEKETYLGEINKVG